MGSKQDNQVLSSMYIQRSRVNNARRAKEFEGWLKEYQPMVDQMYDMVKTNVKGVDPDYSDFCRYVYRSCKNGFK